MKAFALLTAMVIAFSGIGHAQPRTKDSQARMESLRVSNFTGKVSVSPRVNGTGGSRMNAATVTFDPGARTHWHSHPLGQMLIITHGEGWLQTEGEAVRLLRPGDIVWTPPSVKHWHGGTRTTSMTHVAVSETTAGSAVTWLQPVTDAEFKGPH